MLVNNLFYNINSTTFLFNQYRLYPMFALKRTGYIHKDTINKIGM